MKEEAPFASPDDHSQLITGLIQANEQLNHYQAIFDGVSDAIITTDLSFCIQSWNRAAQKMYGWSADEVIGRHMGEVIPTYYHDDLRRNKVIQQFLEEGYWHGEVTQTTKDGRFLHIQATVNRILNAQGRPTHVVAINRDMSAQRHSQKQLLAAQEAQNALLNAVQDSLFLIEPDGTIISANKAFAARFNTNSEAIIGKNIYAFLSDEAAVQQRTYISKTVAKGRLFHFYDKHAGREFENQIYPVINESEQATHLAIFTRDITDYNKTRRELDRRVAEFRNVLETVQLISLMLDEEGKITFCNDFLMQLTGWHRDEIIGQNWFDIFLPDATRAEVFQIFQQTFASGDFPPYYENEIVTRTGELKLIAWYNTTFRGENGRIIGITSIGQDITETRKAEQAIRESEQRFRLLYHSSPLATFHWQFQNQDFTLVDLNQAANDMIQGQGSTFIGQRASVIFAERPDLIADLHKCLTTKNVIKHETTYTLHATKQQRFVIFTSAFVPPNGILLHAEDITDRRRNENELRRLYQAIEQTPTSVIITALNGDIVYVNKSFTKITGYTANEAIGQNPRLLKSGEHSPSFYKNMWETLLAAKEWRGEILNKRKNGQLFWEYATISPIRDDAGNITSFLAVKEEITEQKRLREQLNQQERLAAVGQLASGIAHDFNNIMTIILLYAQLIQKSNALTDKQNQQITTIIQQSNRASELIEQILDFSRQSFLKREQIDLRPLLLETAKLLKRTLPENISFNINSEQTAYPVLADKTRLQQVLMNLSVNARDAMTEGGKLHISIHKLTLRNAIATSSLTLSPGKYIYLEISDTGTGISDDVLPRIFEPFFTTKAPDKGHGLGLAQVYGIIKQHDGEIGVVSKPGAGTTFSIYLPALELSASSNESSSLNYEHSTSGNGQTILIVEDNPSTRQSMVDVLQHLGYRTIAAENGRVALNLLQSQHDQIQLIISDVIMPQMGGVQLLEAINDLGINKPFILVTGHLLNTELQDHHEIGVHAILLKPLDMDMLAQIIHEAINR